MPYNMIKMSILKDAYLKRNLIFFVFLKIITIIILIWIDLPDSNVYTYGRTIENKNKRVSTLNICLKRYLAEYEGETEIDKTGFYKNSPYYFENNGTSNYDDNASIYGNIKNRVSKKLKLYKTAYNHRYAKKTGLSKLDCYYEKKIFDKIDYIYDTAKRMRNDKKSFKKKILQNFGYRLIFLTLIPFLGTVFPIIFNDHKPLINVCYKDHSHTSPCNGYYELLFTQEQWKIFVPVYMVLLSLLTILVLSINFYILIKVLKYERLKCGKGKMNIKEYSCFCRDIFL